MEGPAEEYEVSYLMELPTELLIGNEENPGPLIMLAYPDLMSLELVSRKFREIIDSDYFWKLKTRRDWGVTYEEPKKNTWREEYFSYAQVLDSKLIHAVKAENKDSVQQLLDLGANPNIEDRGMTPLMLASESGNIEIVKLLLDAGAQANYEARDGRTALLYAVWDDYHEIEELLLAEGADVAIDASDWVSPFDYVKRMPETVYDLVTLLKG